MKITKGKTERILLSLLLCSVISSSVYAAERVEVTGGSYHEEINGEDFTGITGNSQGNAIYVNGVGSELEGVADSTFTENSGSGLGGAIYNSNGTIGYIQGTITVDGDTVTGTTIFTGNSSTGNAGGAISNSTGASTIGSISGVIFDGNSASTNAGAIYNNSGSIGTIEGSIFTGNAAGTATSRYGGAIYNYSGGTIGSTIDDEVVGIDNCTFTGNTAGGYGGAIGNNGSTITRIYGEVEGEGDEATSSSYFEGNSARYGGAIYNYNGSEIGSIEGTIFDGNEASYNGGAIDNNSNSSIGAITGSIFTGNTATNGGGAIYNYDGSTIGEITNTVFTENQATSSSGGAIYNYNGEIENITGTTFSGNTATSNGGAIYNYGSSSVIGDIIESSFTYNGAGMSTNGGGAIYNTGGTIGSIINSYFEGNQASSGGAIENRSKLGDISESTFYQNTALNGGAIMNEDTMGSIVDTEFQENTATGNGGAIYTTGGTIDDITGSNFEGNTAGTYGGAIYNNGTGINGIFNSTFQNNSAAEGGALYNGGATIGSIGGVKFDTNTATNYGGAIRNFGTITTITSYTDEDSGDTVYTTFEGNTAGNGGGAIYNYNNATIESIEEGTVFKGNIAGEKDSDAGIGDGGAIYNAYSSVINSITGATFEENYAGEDGGAIYNYDEATIDSITNSTFTSNEAYSDGGAIYNFWETSSGSGEGIIGDIRGNTFTENKSGHYGGAIFNYGYIGLDADGNVTGGITNSTFTGNESGRGGAIYNGIQRGETASGEFDCVITTIENCTFEGNTAYNFGGAIYNYDDGYIWNISNNTFEENKALDGNGGAIENAEKGSVIGTIANNQFLRNDVSASEHGGGAIYSEGSITSITENNFEENKSGNFGGAIYNNGGTIGDEDTGESISNNTFTGNTSDRGGAIYNTANRSVDEDTGDETIDQSSPGIITSIDGNTFSGNIANDFGGAIYNYKYGEITSITGNTFTENAANGGNGGAIENAEPESVIGEITGNTFTKNTATGGGAAIYNEGTIDSITDNTFEENQAGTYGGAIYNHGGTITEVSGDTFTGNSAVSESGEAAGGAIYNSGTISTFSVKDLSGNYAEGATSAMGGAIYDGGASEITVDGDVTDNYVTASSGDAYGGAIYAGEGTVVTLSGNITGNSATGTTAKGGAIYNAGTVNINVENKDAVISGNTTVSGGTEEANVLYGEAASVTNFNLTDATLRLDDSLTGETGFEVNISGNGADATTFYMYNDIADSNLSIGGTTLNTINNEVHTYSVNKFTVAGDFNMVADVDLANESMDRFVTSGNNYGDAKGSLNVSGMNLISDTTADRVGIYFAEPGLKENVTSSVGTLPGSEQQTAYTPLYQYSVSYDKNYDGSWGDDGGYFVFDKQGNNPAAMMPTIAQMGLFNAMNMMFEYCFEHSDYYMKLPSETRLAIREKAKAAKAAKLAAKNGTTAEEEAQKIDDARAEELASREGDKFYDHDNVLPLYDQHELTRPGAWVKTFATKESIPFTGKFTARDKYYGGIIGVDTDFREDKKGWGNVFTGYAGYQGIHQSYSGGSIRQDGGMLGATETFYKKNFYTAWTIAAASTSAKGRNMYGHESSRLYTYGIATKSGWNLEYDGGKYIVLPTFMASYTTVDMRDYTNAAGLKVDADNMRAVQLNPNIKWIRNYASGWQPYLTAGEVWTVGQKSRVRVDGTKLDELHLRPYTEYGLGVQKRWAHDYDGYAEFLGHAGGRRGFLAKLGFRWTFN